MNRPPESPPGRSPLDLRIGPAVAPDRDTPPTPVARPQVMAPFIPSRAAPPHEASGPADAPEPDAERTWITALDSGAEPAAIAGTDPLLADDPGGGDQDGGALTAIDADDPPGEIPLWLQWDVEPEALATPMDALPDALPAPTSEAQSAPDAEATEIWVGEEDPTGATEAVEERAGGERAGQPEFAAGEPEPTDDMGSAGPTPDPTSDALGEVAERLDRIASALRENAGIPLLSGGTADPLELLVAGYALGYVQARRDAGGAQR